MPPFQFIGNGATPVDANQIDSHCSHAYTFYEGRTASIRPDGRTISIYSR